MKLLIPFIDRHCKTQLLRRRYSLSSLSAKFNAVGPSGLSEEETRILDNIWPGLYFNREYVAFYNHINNEKEFCPYYIPDDLYYCFIDAMLNNQKEALVLDNKNYYDLFFYDVPQPRTIARKIDGVFCDKSYGVISVETVIDLCVAEKTTILKPSIGSEGGQGIYVYEEGDEGNLRSYLMKNNNIIIQEVVRQITKISNIHPSSLNTVRILTLFIDNEVKVPSIILRMGVKNARVDNASSGGIFVGVDNNFNLRSTAHDTNGNSYVKHPGGTAFDGISIPEIQQCVDLAKALSTRLMTTSKLISWDFAINEAGTPVLIEANLAYGELDFHQISNGAIFKDYHDYFLKLLDRKDIKLLNKYFLKYKFPLL